MVWVRICAQTRFDQVPPVAGASGQVAPRKSGARRCMWRPTVSRLALRRGERLRAAGPARLTVVCQTGLACRRRPKWARSCGHRRMRSPSGPVRRTSRRRVAARREGSTHGRHALAIDRSGRGSIKQKMVGKDTVGWQIAYGSFDRRILGVSRAHHFWRVIVLGGHDRMPGIHARSSCKRGADARKHRSVVLLEGLSGQQALLDQLRRRGAVCMR